MLPDSRIACFSRCFFISDCFQYFQCIQFRPFLVLYMFNCTFVLFSLDLYGEDKIQGLWTSWINAYINLKKEENGICKSSLQNIECPTLIIHGSKDPIIPDFHAVYIHERIKNSQIHYFPEGRHDLHLMFPGEFNDVVTKFLLTKEKRYIFEV